MCTRDLPDMYALSPWACGPWALGIHIKQIPLAHVTTITCTTSKVMLLVISLVFYFYFCTIGSVD